jgi:hypothetical protein
LPRPTPSPWSRPLPLTETESSRVPLAARLPGT